MNKEAEWRDIVGEFSESDKDDCRFFGNSLTEFRKNKIQKVDKIIDLNNLIKNNDCLLDYNHSPVFAYIRRSGGNSISKVHFTYCDAIKKIPTGKYFCTTNHTGKFEIDIQDGPGSKIRTITKELKPCRFCIGIFYGISDYKYKHEKERMEENFDYSRVFYELGVSLNREAWVSSLYEFTDKSWGEISREKREKQNWTCEKCNLELTKDYSRYLHVHHINHDRNFNHDVNLICVCIKCHSEYEGHSNLQSLPEYKQFMGLLELGILKY